MHLEAELAEPQHGGTAERRNPTRRRLGEGFGGRTRRAVAHESGAGLRRIGASAAEEKIRDRAERIHPYLTDILGRRVRRRSDRRHKGRRQANVEQLAAHAADRNPSPRRAFAAAAVASAVAPEQPPRLAPLPP